MERRGVAGAARGGRRPRRGGQAEARPGPHVGERGRARRLLRRPHGRGRRGRHPDLRRGGRDRDLREALPGRGDGGAPGLREGLLRVARHGGPRDPGAAQAGALRPPHHGGGARGREEEEAQEAGRAGAAVHRRDRGGAEAAAPLLLHPRPDGRAEDGPVLRRLRGPARVPRPRVERQGHRVDGAQPHQGGERRARGRRRREAGLHVAPEEAPVVRGERAAGEVAAEQAPDQHLQDQPLHPRVEGLAGRTAEAAGAAGAAAASAAAGAASAATGHRPAPRCDGVPPGPAGGGGRAEK
mmetsp:Transcript_120632/g.341745  ORF Transcript_120632/g.341745 Transcript_120632/m.341745 type:complete len:297 (-) Transcript_120632:272-1162(-)